MGKELSYLYISLTQAACRRRHTGPGAEEAETVLLVVDSRGAARERLWRVELSASRKDILGCCVMVVGFGR
jgi:hypothetical protein